MDTSSLYTEFNGALQQEVEYIQQSGGEVEWWMGEGDSAEKFAIDTTALVYVPKGLVHGPVTYKRVDKPSLLIAIGLNTGGYS